MKTIIDYTNLIKGYFAGAANLAPVEVSPSANAYSVGDPLMYDGKLYLAKTSIAVNDPLVVDTNIEAADDIMEQLSAKADKPTVLSQTLAANATSVTFTGIPTTGDNVVDFFISDGSNYTEIDVSTPGTAILTYEASAASRTVYCRIEGV